MCFRPRQPDLLTNRCGILNLACQLSELKPAELWSNSWVGQFQLDQFFEYGATGWFFRQDLCFEGIRQSSSVCDNSSGWGLPSATGHKACGRRLFSWDWFWAAEPNSKKSWGTQSENQYGLVTAWWCARRTKSGPSYHSCSCWFGISAWSADSNLYETGCWF